jgi:chemosensory pili system protein ChpA (sensor histidine kinase/response regulator)
MSSSSTAAQPQEADANDIGPKARKLGLTLAEFEEAFKVIQKLRKQVQNQGNELRELKKDPRCEKCQELLQKTTEYGEQHQAERVAAEKRSATCNIELENSRRRMETAQNALLVNRAELDLSAARLLQLQHQLAEAQRSNVAEAAERTKLTRGIQKMMLQMDKRDEEAVARAQKHRSTIAALKEQLKEVREDAQGAVEAAEAAAAEAKQMPRDMTNQLRDLEQRNKALVRELADGREVNSDLQQKLHASESGRLGSDEEESDASSMLEDLELDSADSERYEAERLEAERLEAERLAAAKKAVKEAAFARQQIEALNGRLHNANNMSRWQRAKGVLWNTKHG